MTRLENAAFRLEGSGGAALLVHGLGGGPYELQWLGEVLHARSGLTVEGLRLPGHAPGFAMPHSGYEQWVPTAERAYTALVERAGDAPVHLVGFSTGCLVTLRLAQTRRVTGRLALLSPFLDVYRPPWLPVRPEVLLERVRGLPWVPNPPPPASDRELRREVRRVKPFSLFSLPAARSAKALGALVLEDLARVAAPTLVLQGARDTVVDPAGASRLAAGLRCEHRLHTFERSNHLLALDAEHEQVIAQVVAFLGAAPGAP